MANYTSIPALRHYVVEESWVLGITATPGRVDFDIDLVLAGDHPDYEPPGHGVVVTSHRATAGFADVTSLTWIGQGAPSAADVFGGIDFGSIDTFTVEDDRFDLEGDWGRMTIVARAVGIEVEAN